MAPWALLVCDRDGSTSRAWQSLRAAGRVGLWSVARDLLEHVLLSGCVRESYSRLSQLAVIEIKPGGHGGLMTVVERHRSETFPDRTDYGLASRAC